MSNTKHSCRGCSSWVRISGNSGTCPVKKIGRYGDSDPCESFTPVVRPFVPVLSDAFEALERKAYYRGLLAGLNEAKRHLQIAAAINAKTAEGHCLRGDAAHKLNEVNELIEAAQKECEK